MTASTQHTRAQAPPNAESVALARLLERHKREYDFYLERAKADDIQDPKDLPAFPQKLISFSMTDYVNAALEIAEYEREEDGSITATVPELEEAYTCGYTYEDARIYLMDVIEGNIIMDLQLGRPIQQISGVKMSVDEISSPPVA